MAGFKDPVSGKFDELMLIWNNRNPRRFLRQYQMEETEIRQKW